MKTLIAKASYIFIETRIKDRFDKIKNFFAHTTSKAERHQKIIKEWLECEKCEKKLKNDVFFLYFQYIFYASTLFEIEFF